MRKLNPVSEPGRDDDLRLLDAMLGGDPLAQRRIPAGRAVVEDRPAVTRDDRLRTFTERLDGEDVWRRIAAREGDHVHGGSV